MLVAFILNFLVDIILSFILLKLSGYETIKSFLIIFVILQLFYLIKWLLTSIIHYITYKYYGKEKLVDQIHGILKYYNFPNPQNYEDVLNKEHFLIQNVYKEIINDVSDRDILLQSKTFLDELETLRNNGLAQSLLKISECHREAFKRYSKSLDK